MKHKYIFPLLLLLISKSGYATDSNIWIEVKGGEWLPAQEVIVFVKSATRQAVEPIAQNQQRQLKAWDSYTFQYQGKSLGDHRFVYINAFCKESSFGNSRQLNSSFLVVKDGGSCYFQLKYDPVKDEFYDVFINGEA